MLKQYSLSMPHEVYSGDNAINNMKQIATAFKKVALFTDKGVREAGLLNESLEILDQVGLKVSIVDELPTEPTCDEAQKIVDWFKDEEADLIIAIGGGSVMDIAKLASISATNEYTIRDLLVNPQLGKKFVKTLMIPTTAGTGSEATPNSIVTVPEKELKVGIVNRAMIPDYVILDASFIKNLPVKIASATGVDALAHAIECFTSKKSNPFSQMFALEALDLILNNIEKACLDPQAMKEKNSMLLGSFYAGVAISASGTTAVHALSYPLGGKYHIPHGVSNAIMLVPVMKFNEPACSHLFAQVYDRVVKNGHLTTQAEKSTWMIKRFEEIVINLKIPTNLKEFGVNKDELETLVKSGMEVQRLLVNNMREVTESDARQIYLEIL